MLEPPEAAPGGIADLPGSVLERLLQLLDIRSIACLARTCRALHAAASADGLWLCLCRQHFSRRVEPQLWVMSARARRHVEEWRELTRYSAIYRLLSEYQDIIGLWTADAAGTDVCMYRFSWGPGAVIGTKVTFDIASQTPLQMPFRTLSGSGEVRVHFVDKSTCFLEEVETRSRAFPVSPAAEAAAAVAVSHVRGSPPGGVVLGSSPEGSFEYEIMRFMQVNVAGRVRRRRGSSSGQLLPAEASGMYWRRMLLRRVLWPQPTAQHRLSGLWRGNWFQHGVHVVRLAYDFSGRAAQIAATKVVGQLAFVVQARYLPPDFLDRQHEEEQTRRAQAILRDHGGENDALQVRAVQRGLSKFEDGMQYQCRLYHLQDGTLVLSLLDWGDFNVIHLHRLRMEDLESP